jgi:hypothetical protein
MRCRSVRLLLVAMLATQHMMPHMVERESE